MTISSSSMPPLVFSPTGSALSSPSSCPPLPGEVGYSYEEEVKKHRGSSSHPEQPDRVRSIHSHLSKCGLIDPPYVEIVPAREASKEELEMGTETGREELAKNGQPLVDSDDDNQEEEEENDEEENFVVGFKPKKKVRYIMPFGADTFVSKATPRAARLAAGAVLALCDRIMDGQGIMRRGFAAIRPPGHHATATKAMGFCLFNNVAVAARYLKLHHGLSKVAILDWDVHHGNGTQDIFYEDPDVLFLSMHRFDSGLFFPGTGGLGETGEGLGSGLTLNAPVDGSYGNDEVSYFMDRVVLPALDRFQPEFLLISSGFDACVNDPLGGCKVTPQMFGVMTSALMDWAESSPACAGRVLLVLEGGYNLSSISKASECCLHALLKQPLPLGAPLSTFTPLPRSRLSSASSSSISSAASARSHPPGIPKISFVETVHLLTTTLGELKAWEDFPVAPPKYVPLEKSIKNRKKRHAKKLRKKETDEEKEEGKDTLRERKGSSCSVS